MIAPVQVSPNQLIPGKLYISAGYLYADTHALTKPLNELSGQERDEYRASNSVVGISPREIWMHIRNVHGNYHMVIYGNNILYVYIPLFALPITEYTA